MTTAGSDTVIGRIGGVAVKQLLGQTFQRSAQEKGDRCESDGDPQEDPLTEAADDPEHRAHPNCGSRGKPGDVTGRIAQNHAGAEKADAGQDALDHAADRVRVVAEMAIGSSENESRGGGSTKGHKRVGAKAGRLSVQLAIQAKERPNDQGGTQTQGSLFVST
jgi:hypothetical protein